VSGPDDQLVAEAVAGDPAALSDLLERHGAIVRSGLQRSYQRRLKGEVDLDDVMQVTYLEAFLRIGAFTPGGPGAFSAWLRRIAENNLRDAIRKSDAWDRRRSPVAMANADSCRGLVELVAGGDSPIRTAGQSETERLLELALRQLPDDYQRVLRLYDLEGLTGPEVARRLDRSHGAVKMLVARARDRLGELLGSGSKFFSRRG
jgi:RNA polymerase sigma-70 factor (ECF subfamily)